MTKNQNIVIVLVLIALAIAVASFLGSPGKSVDISKTKNYVSQERFVELEGKLEDLQKELDSTKKRYSQISADFGVFIKISTKTNKTITKTLKSLNDLDVRVVNIEEEIKNIQGAIKDFADSNKVVIETLYDTVGKLRTDLNTISEKVQSEASLSGQTKKWIITELEALSARLKVLETKPHSIIYKKIYCVPKCGTN